MSETGGTTSDNAGTEVASDRPNGTNKEHPGQDNEEGSERVTNVDLTDAEKEGLCSHVTVEEISSEEKTESHQQNGAHEEPTGQENEEISKGDNSDVVQNGSNHNTKGSVINKEEIDSIVANIIKNNLNASKENEENLRDEKANHEYNNDCGESHGDEDAAQQEEIDEGISNTDVTKNGVKNKENEGNAVNKDDYSCDHCGFETDVRTNLVAHMRDEHETKRKNSLLDLKGKKLLKTSHQQPQSSTPVAPPIDQPRVPRQTQLKIEYVCDICSKFASRNLIQVLSHRAERHKAASPKKTPPPNSKKSPPLAAFNTNNNNNNKSVGLKMGIATGRRVQYECWTCNFGDHNLIRVLSHMASSHPKRHPPSATTTAYTCDICDFRTLHLLSLISHRSAVHSGDVSALESRPARDCRMCRRSKTTDDDRLETKLASRNDRLYSGRRRFDAQRHAPNPTPPKHTIQT